MTPGARGHRARGTRAASWPPRPRDCSGVLAVTFLEGGQGLLSRFVFVYLGYITQGGAGGALVSWRWHHSRRRGDCSHVLTACIQTTSLKGAQGVLWRLL